MSLHNETHFHHFLQNKEMNEMYISVFLMSFAQGLISIFIPIYLFNLGYSPEKILFFYLLIALYFISFFPYLLNVIAKIGVKHSISFSVPFYIIYFSGLSLIPKMPFLFYILPAFIALRNIFYNIGYHLNYLEHEDSKERVKEISFLMSLPLIASLLAPLFGGIISTFFNFSNLYSIGSLILALSILPLLTTKDIKEKINFNFKDLIKDIFRAKNLPLTLSFSGYAVSMIIGLVLWPIFLTNFNISTATIGFIVSSAAITTLFMFYRFRNQPPEKLTEKNVIQKRTILHTLGWIGRIFADSVFLAFLVDAYKRMAFKLIQVPWTAYTYDIAKRGNKFRFIAARELTMNIARILFLPIFIFIFSTSSHPFTISFAITALLSLSYLLVVKYK